MAPEDLSMTYRLKIEGEERVKERILAGMTKEQAQEAERNENSKRRKAEKKKDKDEVEFRKHRGQGLWGAAGRPPRRRTRTSLEAHCSIERRDCLQRGGGGR